MANSIGSETFIKLDGEPSDVGSIVQTITRPGVDGVAFRKLGKQPKPFQLTSLEDFATEAAARTAFAGYKDMQGGDAEDLVWRGLSQDYQVTVIEVVQESITAASKILGGVNVADGTDAFLLRARWTLVFLNG